MTASAGSRFAGVRVVVTGASGFIGSHLVERLAAEGAVVGALARTRGRLAELLASPFTFLECDLTDARAARESIRGFAPHTLFHIASHPDAAESFAHATRSFAVNLHGTLNVIEALKQATGKVIVYGDSCKVYGGQAEVPYRSTTPTAPNSSYALSKLAGWQACRVYGPPAGIASVSVRPTLIHGPRQSYNLVGFIVKRLLDGADEIPLDAGTQTRDPLFISDAVDALLAAAERAPLLDGRVVNVGGGHETSVEDLARLVVDVSGRRAVVSCRPQHARATEMWRSYCDNVEASAMLDWVPRTSLVTGLTHTVAYLTEQFDRERQRR